MHTARMDASGGLTQSKTVNGYLLARAKLDDDMITRVLQQAARDYGTREWWQLDNKYLKETKQILFLRLW